MPRPTNASILSIVLVCVALCACSATPASSGGGDRNAQTACEAAFEAAAAIDDMHDSVEDLDPAVRACSTIEAWVSAAAKYPKALSEGVDPNEYLANRCLYGTGLAVTALCQVANPT